MKRPKRNKEEIRYRSDHGALSIDCITCTYGSDMNDSQCVRCVVKGIISTGDCRRIILHGDSDTEYYGDSVNILAKMAEAGVSILSSPQKEEMKKCRLCKARPSSVSAAMWSSFPETDIEGIRQIIKKQEPSGKSCEECLVHTYHSLEQVEFLLNDLLKEAARCAYNLAGI